MTDTTVAARAAPVRADWELCWLVGSLVGQLLTWLVSQWVGSLVGDSVSKHEPTDTLSVGLFSPTSLASSPIPPLLTAARDPGSVGGANNPLNPKAMSPPTTTWYDLDSFE